MLHFYYTFRIMKDMGPIVVYAISALLACFALALLFMRSRRAIRRAGLTGKADVVWGNFWRHGLHEYDLVVLFAIRRIMPRLERKLRRELRPGTPIISNFFTFENLAEATRSGDVVCYQL